MTALILTYRPYEGRDVAAQIGAQLARRFGRDRIVFGAELRPARFAAFEAAVAMLGPGGSADGAWLSSLRTAVQCGVPVVLVLMDGAVRPSGQQWLADSKTLANPHVLELSTIHFDRDVDTLIAALSRILEPAFQDVAASGNRAQAQAATARDADVRSVEAAAPEHRGGLNVSAILGQPAEPLPDRVHSEKILDRNLKAPGSPLTPPDTRARTPRPPPAYPLRLPFGPEPARPAPARPPSSDTRTDFASWPRPVSSATPGPERTPAAGPPISAEEGSELGHERASVFRPRALDPPRWDDAYGKVPTRWGLIAAVLGLAVVVVAAVALAFAFRREIGASLAPIVGALVRGATPPLAAASIRFQPRNGRNEKEER